MTAPPEVLAAMEEAVCEEVDKLICADLSGVSLASVAPAALAAAEALGWRMVPVEPTEEMIEAISKRLFIFEALKPSYAQRIHAAMLAVAPKVTP